MKNEKPILVEKVISMSDDHDHDDDDEWILVEDANGEDMRKNKTSNRDNVDSKEEEEVESKENIGPHVFVRTKNGIVLKVNLVMNATIGWVLSESLRQSRNRIEFSNSIGISRQGSCVTLDLSADVDMLCSGETLHLVSCNVQDDVGCVPHLGPL
jgi:hypothetical protein